MIVYTDSPSFAEEYTPHRTKWQALVAAEIDEPIRLLALLLMPEADIIYRAHLASDPQWQYGFFIEYASKSQFDILTRLCHLDRSLPDGILCLAGSGEKFHGFKNRPWVALAGNLHLSVFLAPHQKIDHFWTGFTVLSAISVIHTLDELQYLGETATIKWVNDILIDRAKVCGVLAQTQIQGDLVCGVVLGIGLNVKSRPVIDATSYASRFAALADYMPAGKCDLTKIFSRLVYHLRQNYNLLLNGKYVDLINFYRARSYILGKNVEILTDPTNGEPERIIRGKAVSIGENLELYFAERLEPVTEGRLAMIP
ncbi:MAG: biotin--[acetyl-CoA-carboxylase] ligase [Candidatus Cloacimonetes bacterium 4572_55]|nr:MAG: biotin--[acetyl-CoA-carboxylase] ligase [Candidatus Cloacimonetes bacterium 4572_55]